MTTGGGTRSEGASPAVLSYEKVFSYGTFLFFIFIIAVPVSGTSGPGLYFVMHDNLPPYEFTDDKGKPTGYAYDLIQALARDTGLHITVISEDGFGSVTNPGPGQVLILPVFTRGS
ncbi:MAG: transporter substrate-binding domain-containing protein, partial [Methanoregulaceae archaeon]|nr:transporter substrate-binding domain-containing protein [Methanoregulaceae archaeon]